jgi:hypothetical protein
LALFVAATIAKLAIKATVSFFIDSSLQKREQAKTTLLEPYVKLALVDPQQFARQVCGVRV